MNLGSPQRCWIVNLASGNQPEIDTCGKGAQFGSKRRFIINVIIKASLVTSRQERYENERGLEFSRNHANPSCAEHIQTISRGPKSSRISPLSACRAIDCGRIALLYLSAEEPANRCTFPLMKGLEEKKRINPETRSLRQCLPVYCPHIVSRTSLA